MPIVFCQAIVQRIFLQPVCFADDALDTVAVNGPSKIPCARAKARLQHNGCCRIKIIYFKRMNRKTPACIEHLFNQFATF